MFIGGNMLRCYGPDYTSMPI